MPTHMSTCTSPSQYLFTNLFVYVELYFYRHTSSCHSTYPFMCTSRYMFIFISIYYSSICLCACRSTCLYMCPSSSLRRDIARGSWICGWTGGTCPCTNDLSTCTRLEGYNSEGTYAIDNFAHMHITCAWTCYTRVCRPAACNRQMHTRVLRFECRLACGRRSTSVHASTHTPIQ